MKWVTRERPKTDRIACPWLIKNFSDAEAEFLYVPTDEVLGVADDGCQGRGRLPAGGPEGRSAGRLAEPGNLQR